MDNVKTDNKISNVSIQNLAIVNDCLSVARAIDMMINGENKESDKDSKCGPDSLKTTLEFTHENGLELLKLLDKIRESL